MDRGRRELSVGTATMTDWTFNNIRASFFVDVVGTIRYHTLPGFAREFFYVEIFLRRSTIVPSSDRGGQENAKTGL